MFAGAEPLLLVDLGVLDAEAAYLLLVLGRVLRYGVLGDQCGPADGRGRLLLHSLRLLLLLLLRLSEGLAAGYLRKKVVVQDVIAAPIGVGLQLQ